MTLSALFSWLWKTTAPISGWCVFAYLTYRKITSYGTRWEFSPRGIPVSKLADEGQHYADGSPVSPLELAMIHSGEEELISFATVLICFLAGVGAVYSGIMLELRIREQTRFRAELEKLYPGKFRSPSSGKTS